MKRILFLTGSMVGGGAERVISVLSNKMAEMDIKVDIILVYSNAQDYALNKTVTIHPIKCESYSRIIRAIKRLRAIRKTVKILKPDCVISFLAEVNIQTLIALYGKKNIPIVISERNDPNRNPTNAWMRKIRDCVYRLADGCVFQTPDAQKYFEGLFECNSVVIPNPLTPDLPYHIYDKANRRLITACRLAEQKNLKMMIDAVAGVQERGIPCRLDIFGVGPQEEELKAYIKQLRMESHIALCGFSKEIHREMCNSAAFIISSNYEGMSNSMIEAMAIGLPVIATDCPIGGARMMIENGKNGFLIPVNDRLQLENIIAELFQNPEIAEKIGHNATAIRDRLDVNKIAQQWSDFILSTIKRHKEGKM